MKKIQWANIEFLSLCPRGKNGLKVIVKEGGKFEAPVRIKKGDDFEKKGELVAAIYVPDLLDEDGHFAQDTEAIKTMAYSHARNGSKLDLRHDGKPLSKDQAYMAESFLIQKGDPRFSDLKNDQGRAVDPTGGWGAVIKLEDPSLRSNYEFEGWEGISLYGDGMLQEVQSMEERVMDRLLRKSKEQSMNEEQIKKLISDAMKPISEVLDELKKVSEKKEKEPEKKEELKAPEFKGDPTKREDVVKFQAELKKYELMKSVNWSDPTAVAKVLDQLDKEAETEKEKGEKENLSKEDKDEIERLNNRIKELMKSSKQSPKDGDEKDKDPESKSARLYKEGQKAAAYINGESKTKSASASA
jgi:hypothetical protein